MSKNLYRLFIALPILWASKVLAADYTLLEPLPGLASDRNVTIGDYLTALYNFFISIVGILAMVMIILGGIEYMTASGNPGKATKGRERIQDAVLGLLLALLSWVILITINPDLRFIKQPGMTLSGISNNLGLGCVKSFRDGSCTCFDGAAQNLGSLTACNNYCSGVASFNAGAARGCVCTPRDGVQYSANYGDLASCGAYCSTVKSDNHCGRVNTACISANSIIDARSQGYQASNKKCRCIDDAELPLAAGGNCPEICEQQGHCGSKFLIVQLHQTRNKDKDNYYSTGGQKVLDFLLTNDGQYGDFTVSAKFRQNRPDFNCAIFVTNQQLEYINNDQYIWWVREGAIIDPKEYTTIYDSLHMGSADQNVTDGCCGGTPDCTTANKLFTNDCDATEATRVLLTRWSADVDPDCGYVCNFAVNDSHIEWRPQYAIKCNNGYWQKI